MNKTIVLAFGGNALIEGDKNSFPEQYTHLTQTIEYIAGLFLEGYRVLVVHGNGPQVGFTLRRSELAQHEVDPIPLDYAVAESQGAIGFMFQRALHNVLKERGKTARIATLVTQTCVDMNDPAFKNPSKPVGGFMSAEQAKKMQETLGWSIMEDAGRGWRRCVASPKPVSIVESELIGQLLDDGVLVIAGGGGGIAVSEQEDGSLAGVEAVIDKDLTAAILASDLHADVFIIPTGVPQVAIHYGKPNQQWLNELSITEAQGLIDTDEFGKGSMQPKVEAVLSYLAACPEGRGIITNPPSIQDALRKKAGTHFIR